MSKIENSIKLDEVSVKEYVEAATEIFKSLKITKDSIELLANPDDLVKRDGR